LKAGVLAVFLGGVVVGAAGLHSLERIWVARASWALPEAAPAAPPTPRVTKDDQYAFAAELYRVERLSSDDAAEQMERVRMVWMNRRYTWEVLRITPLCRPPGPCMVQPFDHARSGRPILQGWLPRLELNQNAHAALARACDGVDACVFTFEGTLASLALSPDQATSLGFSDVVIHRGRPVREGEAWLRTAR